MTLQLVRQGMWALGGPRQSCPAELKCLDWAFRYFGDCVCSARDDVSFALGLMSVLSWAVAEVPQIVTNFFAGSTEGISLTFLLTWTIGDCFNLAGCYLEPATLPTQFYMALMYTITTIVLVGQTFYYEVLQPKAPAVVEEVDEALLEEEVAFSAAPSTSSSMPVPGRGPPSQPTEIISVPLSRKSSAKDIHIASARSLASSYTPTMGSFRPGSHGARNHHPHVGSLLSQSPGYGLPHISLRDSNNSPILRAVAFGVLLIGGRHLMMMPEGLSSQTTSTSPIGRPLLQLPSSGFLTPSALVFSSRRLLQVSSAGSFSSGQNPEGRVKSEESQLGELLGWLMAAIYMGGRIPQIYLNIKRGTVEGLSPLMFLFALTGNVTYVASIVVRSMEWEKLKPNLPWLVDAAVCVLLDIFILCQFVYFSYKKIGEEEEGEEGSYEQLK